MDPTACSDEEKGRQGGYERLEYFAGSWIPLTNQLLQDSMNQTTSEVIIANAISSGAKCPVGTMR